MNAIIAAIISLAFAVVVHAVAVAYWAGQLNSTVKGNTKDIDGLPCKQPAWRGCFLPDAEREHNQ